MRAPATGVTGSTTRTVTSSARSKKIGGPETGLRAGTTRHTGCHARNAVQTQKKTAEEELRRAQAERNRLEQDRKRWKRKRGPRMPRKSRLRMKRSAGLRRSVRSSNRIESSSSRKKRPRKPPNGRPRIKAQKSAQVENNQLEKERKRIEVEKNPAETDVKQSTSSQHSTLTATTQDVTKLATSHEGTYSGRLCNLFTFVGDKAPACWPLALVVRNGIIEGNWISKSMKPAKAYGTAGDDGSVQLNLASWTLNGLPGQRGFCSAASSTALSQLPETGTPAAVKLMGELEPDSLTVPTWPYRKT